MKTKKRAPSLTRRVAILLVSAQIGFFVLAFVVMFSVMRGPLLTYAVGSDIGNEMVINASERAPDGGGLRLRDDPKLIDFLRDHPDMWFIATDGVGYLSGGRDPGFPGTMDDMGKLLRDFAAATRGEFPIVKERSVPGVEKLQVLTGGARVTVDDTWAIVGRVFDTVVVPASIPIIVTVTLVILLATRGAARSIRRAAESAARISSEVGGRRLPVDELPSELVPLVGAVNEALRRIDEGNERRRRFIADAAHELRAPIAVLRTRLDALPDTPLKDALSRDAERLSGLASRLLEMERIHGAALEETVFDLSAMAREAAAEIAPEMIEAGREVEVIAEAPVRVRADRDALRGAALNLLRNAATHGAGAIRARVAPDGAIDVSDEGPGVPAGEGERVFEPFHRASRSRSGAGLGLAIARQTMRAHGGDAVLIETDTPGAVFRLTLPPERVEVGNDGLNPRSRPRFGPSIRRDNRDTATSRPADS